MKFKFNIEEFRKHYGHISSMANLQNKSFNVIEIAHEWHQKKHDEWIESQQVIYGECQPYNSNEWWNLQIEPEKTTHTARLVNIEEIKK